jgi:hypothetical protein
MRSSCANNADPHYPTGIYPILKRFAGEICGTLARLIAYLGTLALLGSVGIHLWDRLPELLAAGPAAKADSTQALRSSLALVVSLFDMPDKTEVYEIFQRPEGGGEDIGCKLGRRVLSTSGSEPKLAEWFARAGLKRGDCSPASSTPASADWVKSAQNPPLRGGF